MTPAPVSLPEGARCAVHVERPAVTACARCGRFACAEDSMLLEGRLFCAECAARPEVNYLEAYRLKYWGKRDGWAWLFGIGGLINTASGLISVFSLPFQEHPSVVSLGIGVLVLLFGVLGILFFFGIKWARTVLLVVWLALPFALMAVVGVQALIPAIAPLVLLVVAINNTRNKLFFKIDVSTADLKKDWTLLHDNRIARSASSLAVGGLLIPFFLPFAIMCGIIGWRRVDPNAFPPIGNKRAAVVGVVLGSIGLLGWAALGAAMAFAR